MRPIDAVLKLRPSNAAQRLGAGSRVCILNPRDVVRSLHGEPLVVLSFEALAPKLIAAGVLQAARTADAAVGIHVPAYALGEGPTPYVLFQEIAQVAAEAFIEVPLFVTAGPIRVKGADDRSVDEAREAVFKHVDAGFTGVRLDPGELSGDEGAAALAEITSPARERELSIELLLKDATPDALRARFSGLSSRASFDSVTVPAALATDARTILSFSEAVAPATLGIDDLPPSATLSRAGVRRISLSKQPLELLELRLPKSITDPAREKAMQTNGQLGAALGAMHRELSALDEASREQVEAFAYHEAVELLTAAGAKGSGTKALAFLAEKSGY